jgi:hypothetical protein
MYMNLDDYYIPISTIDCENIYGELEEIYKSKIPTGAGITREDSFTMFTVKELSTSPTLVKMVKDLGLYEYWQPGPIITTGPYKAIPIHMDYNFDHKWTPEDFNQKAQTLCEEYEILKHPTVKRDTILLPLHNCENSVSYFYELCPERATYLLQTHQGAYYHVAELSDVKEVASFIMTDPVIFNINKLHTAVNFSNSIRVTLSLRFLPCAPFEELKKKHMRNLGH